MRRHREKGSAKYSHTSLTIEIHRIICYFKWHTLQNIYLTGDDEITAYRNGYRNNCIMMNKNSCIM